MGDFRGTLREPPEIVPAGGQGRGATFRPFDMDMPEMPGGGPGGPKRLGWRAFSFDWLGHSRLGWAADSIIVTSHRDADHPPWRGYVYLKGYPNFVID